MAATEAAAQRLGSVLCAALALPGVAPAAEMDVVAGDGLVALRMLSYRDRQAGFERVRVDSPTLQLQLPLAARWSVDASATRDSVSGASPRWHSAVSGASRLRDNRSAFDARFTHHGERDAWSLGTATSDEHDYESRALSLEWRRSSEDHNRTLSLSAGHARDRIGSSDDSTLHARRRSTSAGVALTQVLSQVDVAQASLTHTRGRGFFDDPYKALDSRPDRRDQTTLLMRWNHHAAALAGTLRTQWRYYHDSFGVRAHSLALDWVQSVGERWQLTPSLRVHTQSAARFYADPVYDPSFGAPFPPGYFDRRPQHLSMDHRLSAFGAVTLGLKLEVRIDRHWSADLRADRYEQRSSWRIGGSGSPGLEPLQARWVQAGLVYRF